MNKVTYDDLDIEIIPSKGTVKVCLVTVNNIKKYAEHLVRTVQDNSWILDVDKYARASFEKTVEDTTKKLVEVFNYVSDENEVGKEFGELLVSMGAAETLVKQFSHSSVPLSELWKPKLSGNEGFDFHTVCEVPLVNFGEAKFLSSSNPYRDALEQIARFVREEKHMRDAVYLEKLVNTKELDSMLNGEFGVVASFSVNAVNPQSVMINALEAVNDELIVEDLSNIYVIGVRYENS